MHMIAIYSYKLSFLRHCLLPILLLFTSMGQAQTVSMERILFEPYPIPTSSEGALPLYSFNAAVEQAVSAQSTVPIFTMAERLDIEESIAAYVAEIGDKEAAEGPYSDQLQEGLFSAGILANKLGDHDQALDFFQRAQGVSRINYGLDNLDQIPIMNAITDSYENSDQMGQADRTREAILELMTHAYGAESQEIVPVMLDYGIWSIDAFLERSNILVNIDRMNVTEFMIDPHNYIYQKKSIQDTPLFHLYQAQQIFIDAITNVLQQENYLHTDLLDLEQQLLASYFLSIHRENIVYEPDFYLTRKKNKTGSRLNTNSIELMESQEYKLGKAAHERKLTYLTHDSDISQATKANVMLEAADWHLLFERKVKAVREYQNIYSSFQTVMEQNDELSATLYPDFPVILPVYLPPPNSKEKLEIDPEEPARYFGYIDVSFQINRYGKAKKVRILEQSGEVNRNMEIRLQNYLKQVLFRPRFKDGEPDTEMLNVRYYLGV